METLIVLFSLLFPALKVSVPYDMISHYYYGCGGYSPEEEVGMSADALDRMIEDASRMIAGSKHVVALTGAGISVESGIPPFRGPGGLWTKYGEPDNKGYQRFLQDPKAWWEARLRGEGVRPEMHSFDGAAPNPGHYALAELEAAGVLKYLITQNVDNLHYAAGNKNVAEIHGNRYKLRCISCIARFPQGSLPLDDLPPRCPECGGIVKTDGVAFGEPIPTDVLEICRREAMSSDCTVVIGTSAVVYPAAELPVMSKRRGAYLIEVNPYETDLSFMCDLSLQGASGEVLPTLVSRVKELVAGKR